MYGQRIIKNVQLKSEISYEKMRALTPQAWMWAAVRRAQVYLEQTMNPNTVLMWTRLPITSRGTTQCTAGESSKHPVML